jgi:hypothetical protein
VISGGGGFVRIRMYGSWKANSEPIVLLLVAVGGMKQKSEM